MSTVRRIVGIDGCRAGWFAVFADSTLNGLDWFVAATISDVVAKFDEDVVIGIDIPIGIPDAGPRGCDALARQRLAPGRTSSVFPAPIRPILGIRDYARACDLRQSVDGKRMSVQAFNILPKIHQVDRYLRARRQDRPAVYEVHPELAFSSLNDGVPMRFAKRTSGGFDERLGHLRRVYDTASIGEALAAHPRSKVARDDVLDAFAVLASVQRIVRGQGNRVPADPVFDSAGLDMSIWF